VHQFVYEQFAIGEAARGPSFISSLAIRLVFYHQMSVLLESN